MIERYKPLYYKNSELMTKKFRVTRLGTPVSISVMMVVVLAITVHPAWLLALFLSALYFLLVGISVDLEDNLSFKEERMFLRRQRIEIFVPTQIRSILRDALALKDDDLRAKVLEYLDCLRSGGERSHKVEYYLGQLHEVVNASTELEMESSITGIIDEDLLRSKVELLRAKREIAKASRDTMNLSN